jgi:hypothetical protein
MDTFARDNLPPREQWPELLELTAAPTLSFGVSIKLGGEVQVVLFRVRHSRPKKKNAVAHTGTHAHTAGPTLDPFVKKHDFKRT